jgi:hypothetical protein
MSNDLHCAMDDCPLPPWFPELSFGPATCFNHRTSTFCRCGAVLSTPHMARCELWSEGASYTPASVPLPELGITVEEET